MVRRIGFGDGDDGRKRPSQKRALPDMGRERGRSADQPESSENAQTAPPPDPPPSRAPTISRTTPRRPDADVPSASDAAPVARGDGGTLRLILGFGVAIFVAQTILSRLGGLDGLLRLPDALAGGYADPVDLAFSVIPPIVIGYVVYKVLSGIIGFGAAIARSGVNAEQIESAYEAATPRDARAAYEELRRENPDLAEAANRAEGAVDGCGRAVLVVFLLFWLTGWSAGILFAGSEFLRGASRNEWGPDTLFLGFWCFVAIIAWLFAVRVLISAIRGEKLPIGKRRRGVRAGRQWTDQNDGADGSDG